MDYRELFKKSLRHSSTILFVAGFIFDLLILPDAGHVATIWIGVLYLGIVAASIAIRELVISRNTASETERKLFSILTFSIAYFSGSALSFVCVYALRSATFSVSWPLLLILFFCVLANEVVSSHHFRFNLDIGVLLFATLFFVVFNLPVILKVQNDMTFLFSTGITIALSLAYIYLLQFTSESASEEAPRLYALSLGIPMFVSMLYFLNVIPAVPLALGERGVYHSIVRSESGSYSALAETDSRFLSRLRTPVYHISNNDNGVYFFSSVIAPALLTAPISHEWEYYNPKSGSWESQATIAFDLSGGRENGYRAYSQKQNVQEGLWRVSVKVGSNRVIGRVRFYVEKISESEAELVKTQL